MRNALVIGASGGLGAALAARVEAEEWTVRRISRRDDGFEIADEASVAAAGRAAAGAGPYALILIATGVLAPGARRPEKAFSELDPAAMTRLFAVNAAGPALVIKHFAPLLAPKGRSVLAALSARVGSIGDNRLGGWMSYRASKAALNQIVRCAAIEIARTRPEAVVASIHPGTVDTRLARPFANGRFTASPDAAAAQILETIGALTPAQSGGFFAYDGTEIEW